MATASHHDHIDYDHDRSATADHRATHDGAADHRVAGHRATHHGTTDDGATHHGATSSAHDDTTSPGTSGGDRHRV